MQSKETSEKKQQELYDQLITEYDKHYGDELSHLYRNKFIYDPLFQNINLEGSRVLEAMCGSGQVTGYLLKKDALVTGLDISKVAINNFNNKWPSCEGIHGSIYDIEFPDDYFDCVVVMGGLHHVHPYVEDAIHEIHRVLKSEGYFCFVEPHAGSFMDVLRKIWYKFDDTFEDNEAAVDLELIKAEFDKKFTFLKQQYAGNIAYLLVYNSLIFRVPLKLKKLYAKPLMQVETFFQFFMNKVTACFAISVWQKR